MQKKKINSTVTAVVVFILFLSFCFGIFYLISVQNEFLEVNRTYKKIQTEYVSDESEEVENSGLIINWTELKQCNPDIIAWIDIPGTNISYPVVQGKDNEEYLRHDIYHKYSKAGSIFVDSRNAKPFEDYNTIIYGHNLQNSNVMFSSLKKYSKADFANTHPIIYIYLPDGSCLEYKIFSFHKVSADDADIYCTDVSNQSAFVKAIQENNKLNISVDKSSIQSVISLSTCTNQKQNERFVLHAVQYQ